MRLLILLLLLFPFATHAQQGIKPDDIRLELELEERPHPPHVGEMLLLRILGTFKVPVVRENLQQSPLTGFDWMQLGEDRWFKAREDGFEVLKFERRMALFPQKPGVIEIPPFVHAVEVLNPSRETVPANETSNPLNVQAVPLPESEDWWFPVRGLEVSDRWSNQPEALDAGAAALRIVALTVEGTAPQRIPPMPELTGAGAFIFPHPEQKIVSLGPDGPITRVFWRWTVRPDEGTAGYTNPIPFRYFDAQAREMRTITLSAQRVAYAEGPQEVIAKEALGQGVVAGNSDSPTFAMPRWSVPLALVFGIVAGVFWILRLWSRAGVTLPTWLKRNPAQSGLSRAVRTGDPGGVWRNGRALTAQNNLPEPLQKLEKALFGNGEMPELRDVARAIRTRPHR